MTQNNLYMEDENLRLEVNVQPFLIDELENSKNIAVRCANDSSQILELVKSIKTNFELFYADASNSFSNLFNNAMQTINNAKNNAVNSINSLGHQVIDFIKTEGQRAINQIQSLSQQVINTVDNNVSLEYLNHSKCVETGNVSENSHILPFIKKYFNSTFDLSKFAIVGSPTITRDGIASGFSENDYLRTLSISELIYKANSWSIKCKFTTSTIGERRNYIIALPSAESECKAPRLWYNTDGRIHFDLSYTGITWDVIPIGETVLSANTTYYVKVVYTGTEYQLLLSTDGENYIIDAVSAKNFKCYNGSFPNLIGKNYNGFPMEGSIDLKQFSITVDGVEVFSGNKTCIDTIKPVDFTASTDGTVYTNPTLPFSQTGLSVTSDGIMTTTSDNSMLIGNASLSGTEIKFTGSFKITEDLPTGAQVFLYQKYIDTTGIYAQVRNINGNFYFTSYFRLGGDGIFASPRNRVLQKNIKYLYEATYNTSTGYQGINIYTENGQLYDTANLPTEFVSYTTITDFNIMALGGYGSIDLNSFKIYVDGNLVYQPCLKIPYTESKTGSKIVDSTYRDRVNDMYEQFGYAPYYTLSDTDFTLPMGEIYGMMQKIAENSVKEISQ